MIEQNIAVNNFEGGADFLPFFISDQDENVEKIILSKRLSEKESSDPSIDPPYWWPDSEPYYSNHPMLNLEGIDPEDLTENPDILSNWTLLRELPPEDWAPGLPYYPDDPTIIENGIFIGNMSSSTDTPINKEEEESSGTQGYFSEEIDPTWPNGDGISGGGSLGRYTTGTGLTDIPSYMGELSCGGCDSITGSGNYFCSAFGGTPFTKTFPYFWELFNGIDGEMDESVAVINPHTGEISVFDNLQCPVISFKIKVTDRLGITCDISTGYVEEGITVGYNGETSPTAPGDYQYEFYIVETAEIIPIISWGITSGDSEKITIDQSGTVTLASGAAGSFTVRGRNSCNTWLTFNISIQEVPSFGWGTTHDPMYRGGYYTFSVVNHSGVLNPYGRYFDIYFDNIVGFSTNPKKMTYPSAASVQIYSGIPSVTGGTGTFTLRAVDYGSGDEITFDCTTEW